MNRTQSIRFRIAAMVSLAIVLSLGGFALFLNAEIRDINERDETEQLHKTNMMVLDMIAQTDSILRGQAESWAHSFTTALAGRYALEGGDDDPVLKLNGVALNGSTGEVDAFSLRTRGNVATVFAKKGDDFVRVTTSVKKEDGTRAVGTLLGKEHPAYALVREGKSFTGKATLFGRDFMTKYDPIRDASGQVIGLHFVGIDIVESIARMKETIKKIKLGSTGYVYVLDASSGPKSGTLIVHPVSEGENLIDVKDSDSRAFIREMIEKRNGTVIYPWMNKEAGDTRPRNKIVVYNEYKDWNWIVASGSYTDEIFSLAERARNLTIAASFVLTIVLLAILTWYLNRIVIVPLVELVRSSQRIADGDLSVRLDTNRGDEIGAVMRSMHEMAAKLGSIIGGVRSASDTIGEAAQQMSVATNQVSTATEAQVRASAASVAALEEVTASSNKVSTLAGETEAGSQKTSRLTGESVTAIHAAVDEIESMANAIGASSEQVAGLVKRSEEVGGIAGVIREIADQTNLLALNAAIEAARAGEQGRGFAVVADEVRKLAERTTKATHEIARVIGQIQDETRQTVSGMEAVTPKIQHGLAKVSAVASMLDTISAEATDSRTRALAVANATREQAAAANEVAKNVEHVAQMTQNTNATMRTNVENATRLQQMAHELRQQVAYFKLA
ncbi:MAG TPA: methyl-accepting chemotaxis protein [Accumulibacter sp.]|uniref:methyl-accepting chemotaxis protein n=1 Tax=Accumulibacter sp. TaxID=2053492 RepID=UPI0025E05F8B|nr:methyl-accepting chemotaxis protein [Accumulibacter sp.]MCM8597049.1 methyl-accepting chemotaxis protein [Accumulibacter sp.]MCM8663670.1 methyl-accepting chemotaxis protein [Accumulibacter sp.]HNC51069.1 methyl-accepting chemotaxis protein [Accumulibacter sp.]